MKNVKIAVVPKKNQFLTEGTDNSIDFKAICIFLSTGFFLDLTPFGIIRRFYNQE